MFLRCLILIGFLLPIFGCTTPDKAKPVFSEAEVSKMVSFMEEGRDRGEILNKAQMKEQFTKKTVRGVTREGQRIGFSLSDWPNTSDLFATYYDENGQETGRDKGSWWTMGSLKLCGRLQNYDNAKPHCFTVGKQGDEYALVDGRDEQVYRFRVMGDFDPSASNQSNASKNSNDNEDTPVEYRIGRVIGYSEVCAEFRGSGANPQMIQTIKQLFGANPDFKRGYGEFDNFTGFDFVTGLTECDRVRADVEKVYNIVKAKGG